MFALAGSLRLASASQIWCGLVLARLSRLPSAPQGCCAFFFSLPALFVAGGYLFFQLCHEACVRCPSLNASPIGTPVLLVAPAVFAAATLGLLGPPSALQALYAGWVCQPVRLITWACPLCCEGAVCWLGLYATPLSTLGSLPEPAVCLGATVHQLFMG